MPWAQSAFKCHRIEAFLRFCSNSCNPCLLCNYVGHPSQSSTRKSLSLVPLCWSFGFIVLFPMSAIAWHGSIYSGSEMGYCALNSLVDVLNEHNQHKGGGVVRMSHAFAVESVGWKQQWILDHHSPSILFQNAKDLADERAFDIVSQRNVEIPSCHTLWFGFSCAILS